MEEARIVTRSQGNLARTPDVAVVIHLNNFPGPVDDTVTAQTYYRIQNTARNRQSPGVKEARMSVTMDTLKLQEP